MKTESQRHSLRRTSPYGQNFVGVCTLCGTEGLTFSNMNDDCPNQRGLSDAEALAEAIKGPKSHN